MELKKYNIITYGCQMNLHESEKVAGMLEHKGLILTEELENADVILINTCCIRKNAENRVVGNLGYLKKITNNKKVILGIFGCMTQQRAVAEELFKKNNHINLVFGTHNIHKFPEYLERVLLGERVLEVFEKEDGIKEDLPVSRSSGINAWVNISYGCNNFCSYCIVPFVRGREANRSPEAIISEVEALVRNGYKEVTLLGQNVNSYMSSRENGEKVDFARLLDALAQIEGQFIIRFLTSHPKDITDEAIKIIAKHERLSKHFHLPLQSGSDKILKLMNRKYSIEHYENRIAKIRKHIPNAGITTDIIVGFPGEGEDDFEKSLKALRKIKFNNIYSFVFSPRDGTKAADLRETVPKDVANRRLIILQDTQQEIQNNLAKSSIGSVLSVLCETYCKKNANYRGKSIDGRQVSFVSGENQIGNFLKIKITKAKNSNLIGEIIE